MAQLSASENLAHSVWEDLFANEIVESGGGVMPPLCPSPVRVIGYEQLLLWLQLVLQ